MKTIITKIENNRVVKFIECEDAEERLVEVQTIYPDALIYDGCYSPNLWVENGEVTIVELAPVVKTNSQLLAETDVWMSRVTEDTVAALLSAGVVVKTDYAPIVIERINYRRSLRNQPPL